MKDFKLNVLYTIIKITLVSLVVFSGATFIVGFVQLFKSLLIVRLITAALAVVTVGAFAIEVIESKGEN